MLPFRLISRKICLGSSAVRTKSTDLGIFNRLFNKKPDKELQKQNYGSYEGDGKTVAVVINKPTAQSLLIGNVKTDGFIMSSGAEIIGSMILFPHSIMSWNVTTVEDVTEDSLTLFKILEPKLDILVFGYGNPNDLTFEMRQSFTQMCRKLGIRFEALPTVHACGVYNFLAEEKRFVAAALIPPPLVDPLAWDRKKDVLLLEDDELEALPGDTQEKKLLE